jgi:hypothetical protein
MCPKFAAPPQPGLFLWFQTHSGDFGSASGTGNCQRPKESLLFGRFVRQAEYFTFNAA